MILTACVLQTFFSLQIYIIVLLFEVDLRPHQMLTIVTIFFFSYIIMGHSMYRNKSTRSQRTFQYVDVGFRIYENLNIQNKLREQ